MGACSSTPEGAPAPSGDSAVTAAVTGRRWVSLETGPWRPEYTPNVMFLAPEGVEASPYQPAGETYLFTGTDGCNDLGGFGEIAGDSFALTGYESTAVGCEAYAEMPQDGQRIRLSPSGSTFDLLDDEVVVATYLALDSLLAATVQKVTGEWDVTGGSPGRLVLGAEGLVGTCSFRWTLAAGELSGVVPQSDPTTCGAEESVRTLVPALGAGLRALQTADARDLYLVGEGTVLFHLAAV